MTENNDIYDAHSNPDGETADDAAVRWMIFAKKEQRRAIKAEQERDEARALAQSWQDMTTDSEDRARKAEQHLRARTVDLVAAIEDRDKARRERDELRAAAVERESAEVCVRGYWFKRSELPGVLGRVMDRRDEAQREAKRHYLRTVNRRPLTADDGMLSRAVLEARKHKGTALALHSEVQAIVNAALTEPPSRPEGAEEIERLLTEGLGDFSPPATPEAVADLLAVRGIRVTGGQS